MKPDDLAALLAAHLAGHAGHVRCCPQWAVLELDPTLRRGKTIHWSLAEARAWLEMRDEGDWPPVRGPVAIFTRLMVEWPDGAEFYTPWESTDV